MAPTTPFPIPPAALAALEALWERGHAAYLVGGGVRDGLLGIARPEDIPDLATDALPDEVLAILPDGRTQGSFGTVAAAGVEITTFRRDHRYGDHRRPDEVTFTRSLEEDLARRDFSVNAVAWGRGTDGGEPRIVDPTGGLADLASRTLRAVGDPDVRFDEDALRILRAARLAAQVGLSIEPTTLEAMARHAENVRFLSGERVGMELRRMLVTRPPSTGFRILADTGVLATLLPELDALRAVPQDKPAAADAWSHTLLTLDAAADLAPADGRLAWAALLHDVGKAPTMTPDGFPDHAAVGERMATVLLDRLAVGGSDSRHVGRLVREHMFGYEPAWSDAAVRRFMRRVGPDLVDDLLRLRAADNLGSGWPADAGFIDELRARIGEQRQAGAAMTVADLCIDGHDVMGALDREPGPWLGEVLDRLLEEVLDDPGLNESDRLLARARELA